MPYTQQSKCVYKADADGKPTGEALKCFDTDADAQAYLAALTANVSDAKSLDLKAGARHNAQDRALLQEIKTLSKTIAKHADTLGAESPIVSEMKEQKFSNTLKTISQSDEQWVVGNYIVLFGGRDASAFGYVGNTKPIHKNADGTLGEYFTPQTDLESEYTKALQRLPVDWEHGIMELSDDEILGYVDWSTKTIDDKGVFVQRILNRRNQYVKWIEELNGLGYEFGTSSQAVDGKSERADDGALVKWPLKRDTLTYQPAEPRMLSSNALTALKALGLQSKALVTKTAEEVVSDEARAQTVEPQAVTPIIVATPQQEKQKNMTNQNNKAEDPASATPQEEAQEASGAQKLLTAIDDLKKLVSSMMGDMATVKTDVAAQKEEVKAVKTALMKEPARNSAGVAVIDNQEKPFKNLGDFMFAVREATVRDITVERANRLDGIKAFNMKATGAGETVGSDGGFLVQSDQSQALWERAWQTGQLFPKCAQQNIGPQFNGVKIPAVDETSRANGSRWGGIRAYWAAEGGTTTATKPKFNLIELSLKKLFAVIYASDELNADAAAFESFLMRTLPLEIGFNLDTAIIEGTGAGTPLGVLNAPATVSVAKETQAAKTIVFENIVNMWSRLWSGARNDVLWLINQDVEPQLFGMTKAVGTGGVPVYLPAGGLSEKPYSTLFGRPVFPMEQCATLGTVGDIVLFSPSAYITLSKGGLQQASSMHVQFLTDEMTYRWVYRTDGQPLWRSALTPFKGTNTQSPFITLATRA